MYAGLDRENYNRVIPDIYQANRIMIVIFSGLATALIGVMCCLSLVLSSAGQNKAVYIGGFIGSLILFLISSLYAKIRTWVTLPLVYVSFSIFLLYGIFIGTITNPTQQTVTFMVMLVFMPVLFTDKPIRVYLALLFYVCLFIGLCYRRKTGDVLSTDVMDAIIFGILGSVSGTIINHIKVRNYVLEHKLQDASRFDMLTKMNNRNSFEEDLAKYPERVKENLCCIYVDVNGLHELNNLRGHKAGDEMLMFIAEKMRDCFGAEYTYRLGGDEFVAFAIDKNADAVASLLIVLKETVEKEQYHIAIGFDHMEKDVLDMDALIKAAEAKMYESKSQFYKDSGRDRRK